MDQGPKIYDLRALNPCRKSKNNGSLSIRIDAEFREHDFRIPHGLFGLINLGNHEIHNSFEILTFFRATSILDP